MYVLLEFKLFAFSIIWLTAINSINRRSINSAVEDNDIYKITDVDNAKLAGYINGKLDTVFGKFDKNIPDYTRLSGSIQANKQDEIKKLNEITASISITYIDTKTNLFNVIDENKNNTIIHALTDNVNVTDQGDKLFKILSEGWPYLYEILIDYEKYNKGLYTETKDINNTMKYVLFITNAIKCIFNLKYTTLYPIVDNSPEHITNLCCIFHNQ